MSLYAVIFACSMASGECILVEDDLGPYDTAAECEDRLAEMVPLVSGVLPLQLPGSISLETTCTTLYKIRSRWPGAYGDLPDERGA